MNYLVVLVVLVLQLACGKSPKPSLMEESVKYTKTDGPTILVIDSGFDLTHPVFENKLVSSYTLVCGNEIPFSGNFSLTYEENREAYIEFLNRDSSCHLQEGIAPIRSELASLSPNLRTKWNSSILSKGAESNLDTQEFQQVVTALSATSAHGTGTASIIAYDNPDARFVIVERQFASIERGEVPVECFLQSAIDLEVRLMKDSVVRASFQARQAYTYHQQMREIIQNHRVKIANLSYGRISRETIEKNHNSLCPTVDFGEYFKATAELNSLAKDPLFSGEIVTIQAAGNEGVRIDSHLDSFECGNPDQNHLLLGSHSFSTDLSSSKISLFSQSGDCVNAYAPGEGVLVAAPEGFVSIADGTSFSSPMAVRAISKLVDLNQDPETIVALFFLALDERNFLPSELYPGELLFANTAEVTDSYQATGKIFSNLRLPRSEKIGFQKVRF